MDGPSSSVQRYNRAKRRLDTEPPFRPFFSNADTAVSRSNVSLPSAASVPSPSSPIRCQHQYCLTNGNGKGNDQPWLSLRLTSRSPKPEYLPMFIGKDTVSGTVELELTKPENIREVIVTVCVIFPPSLCVYHNHLTTT
jgi:hypothetical protein